MTHLKNNINYYMELKGIKKYSHLLINIAHELGIRGKEAYNFAQREKSNFTKMLNGKRPLKYEFIIPLEKIFGVSLARLLEENAYKLPVEKNNVPFNKGFRYYAYLDDPKLYKEEFDLLLANDGKSIITQTDEFNKTFLDYIVEYGAVNGVRYLHEEYGIKLKWYYNNFDFNVTKGGTWVNFHNAVGFARLVASMNDADLFNDIYDSYNMFFRIGDYGGNDGFYNKSDYLEIILDNDHLFKSIFEIKQYDQKLSSKQKREKNSDTITHYSINPIINNCLRYSLQHLDKYRHRAIEILNFAIKYNREVFNELGADSQFVCIYGELGGLRNIRNEDYLKVVIFVDVNAEDSEIKDLVSRLHKFNKYY